jgi:hypothetical protein
MLDFWSRLDFLTVFALFLAWPSRKTMDIVVLLAWAVLESKVVYLQTLNPAGCLLFDLLKIHEPGQRRVVYAQVELLPLVVLAEMLWCSYDGQ